MTNTAAVDTGEFPFYDRESQLHWWEQLPDGFATHREKFQLDFWSDLKIRSLSVSDYLFRTYASLAVMLSNANEIKQLLSAENREKWEFYKNPTFLSDPSLYFKKPEGVTIRAQKARMPLLNLKDAIVEDLTFASNFTALNPAYPSQLPFGEDHPPTRARYIGHPEKDRPTIICIHGFVIDGYDINTIMFDVRRYYNMGMNVLLYTMPFHGPRKHDNSRFSGDGFFSLDITAINEHMAYSTYDLRAFVDYLYRQGAPSVGLTGFSLGGYQTALAASVDERISFAIPIIPLVSIIDLIFEWEPVGTLIRSLVKLTGLEIKDLRHAMAVHSPISRPVKTAKDKLFIIAGMGDRMASPKHARLLWEHWNRPEIHWFPGNHLIHVERKKFLDQTEGFLREHSVL